MDVFYRAPGCKSATESILMFQNEDDSPFWTDPLYAFYPRLDRQRIMSLRGDDRLRYLSEAIGGIYKEQAAVITDKAGLYNLYWSKNRARISAALSDAFETDSGSLFNDLVCDVSLNPVSPRFLRERRFEVFYLNSEKGALGVTIHEIIHFIWFHVWNRLFNDSYDEYERPSLKWILSEMVVEPIMGDERLSLLNPYYPREKGGCIYPYFFDMTAGGQPVMKQLDDLYKSTGTEDFMKKSYQLLRDNEAEIRRQIDSAERGEKEF